MVNCARIYTPEACCLAAGYSGYECCGGYCFLMCDDGFGDIFSAISVELLEKANMPNGIFKTILLDTHESRAWQMF